MFEAENFAENSNFGDAISWLSAQDKSSPFQRPSLPNSASGANPNLDRVLFNDLVEMVPLVQSLIDRKARSSFTRHSTMIYTKTPSRESLHKKGTDTKGRNMPHKKKDSGEKDQGKNLLDKSDADNFSIFSSRSLASEKDREELVALKEQVEELQRKLSEKDELLKSAENSKNQMNDVYAKLDELKRQGAEKDSLLKSTHLQLSDAKIKLADKQAALEKIHWEASTSNKKVETLQEQLNSMQGEISSFMLLIEGLTRNNHAPCTDNYDVKPYDLEHLHYIDDVDEMEMQKMEEARKAYIAAVTAAKENQDEESIAAAAGARLHLQSFVFTSQTSACDLPSSS